MIYTSQSDIMMYLDTARVDDVIITQYESNTVLRIITSASSKLVDFRNISRLGVGSFDTDSGSWDCGGVRSLEYLGNGLGDIKQTHPELFL